MLRFITSLLLLASFSILRGQTSEMETENNEVLVINDSISGEEKPEYPVSWGLRLGVNLVPTVSSIIREDKTSFEILADYRISQRVYIAGEYGQTYFSKAEDFFSYNTEGSYYKVGAYYNAYQNWLDMNNEIFVGFRYGLSNFNQYVNEITEYYQGNYFPPMTIENPEISGEGLFAHSLELNFGLKVETLKNLFMGVQAAWIIVLNESEPENFSNLFIPGVGRSSINNMSARFSYTISYLIPFKQK